jgi:EAL domain-containing protein (putative c-di-GMP-specific phosphodiesterase class I)
MADMRKSRFGDVPPGLETPISAATNSRDAHTLDMVAEAIAHNQCLLAFQSVMVANDLNRVGFYEGLIRVMDDTGRIIPAKDFMPAVERSELGREIDRLALRMGLQTLQDNPGIRISINMSARSIGYQPWMQTLNHWLKRDPTLGERLILEITESSAIDQPEITRDFMSRIAEKGICFALDDFGSGYTALRYFKEFYFDVLKIDGAFCRGISGDPDNQALVASMIDIARHFDMLTVGEGVERAEDVQQLISMGVDCLQGFYFNAPTTRPHWTYADRRAARQSSSAA